MFRSVDTALRYLLVGSSRVLLWSAEATSGAIRSLEMWLDGVQNITVAPASDIPFPQVDMTVDDPISAMLANPSFGETIAAFENNDATNRALVSIHTQALIYSTIRNLLPEHVVEI